MELTYYRYIFYDLILIERCLICKTPYKKTEDIYQLYEEVYNLQLIIHTTSIILQLTANITNFFIQFISSVDFL